MKSKKYIVAALICLVILATGGIIWGLSRSAKNDLNTVEQAAIDKQREEEKNVTEIPVTETPAAATPTATPEPTPEAAMVFETTDDIIYTTADQANLRVEPSIDAEVAAVVPMSSMIRRTGISDEWSRLSYEEQECYVANELITATPPEAAESEVCETPAGKTVILDPGHQRNGDSTQEAIGPGAAATKGRVTSGTSGCVSGWDEYELNLAVSLQLRDELVNRGYTVYMTRETHDINISNMERAQFAAEHQGDILVRIHANGSTDSSVSGALCMAPSQNNSFLSGDLIAASQSLSQGVIDSYVAATGFNNQGVYLTDEMSGINWASMPVTIVEMGYMSNPSDDALMADSQMQIKMVQGIANGIDSYFGG